MRRQPGRTRPPVLIIGLDCITGLQSARLLAARRVPVIGLAADRGHFCARTRVVERVVQTPLSGDGLLETLDRLAPEFGGSAVPLPCTDAAVATLSAARHRLADSYRFVLPPHEIVDLLMDKVRFAEHARRAGLPIPETHVIRDRRDAEAAAASLVFPVVLKPPLKTARWLAATRAKAYRVEDQAAFLARYDEVCGWSDVLLAQSWIEGGEDALFSWNGYFDRNGEPQVSFVARKIRQWPPETGTSALGIEVRNDEVLDIAIRLFRSIGYRGLGYLEVKRDARTGEHAIVEPNVGRPTGRSAIAERGGVELLLSAYLDALGEPLPPQRTQRYRGVRWIYWRHDLQAALVRKRAGKLSVRGWWQSVRGPKIEAVMSLSDPMPGLLDVGRTATAAARAAIRRAAARSARRARRSPRAS